MSKKIVIIFYSFEGSTKLIANTMVKIIKADILELKPIKSIKSKGFMKYFWGGRQVLFKKQPRLEIFNKNPNDYDVIIIGTPVWAYTYSPPIRSFLNQVNLCDKILFLFCCHEGSKGKTISNLKKELSQNTILDDQDFFDVKTKTQENVKKAKKWANEIKHKINN